MCKSVLKFQSIGLQKIAQPIQGTQGFNGSLAKGLETDLGLGRLFGPDVGGQGGLGWFLG